MIANRADLLLARAQVGMALLFSVGFICILIVLLCSLTGVKELPASTNALLTGLLGVFATIITLQQNYFFARQRPHGLPDPSTVSTVQTTQTVATAGPPPNQPPPEKTP